jgi:hypothetical protein
LGCSKQQHTTAIASLVLTFILSIGDLQQARSHAQNPLLLHLIGVSIGVPAGVRPFPLLGQRSDEFAAEVGDVGDHAAPDQVRSGLETLKYVSAAFSSGAGLGPLRRLVCSWVWPARRRR